MYRISLFLSLFLSTAAVAGEVFIPAAYRGPGVGGSAWKTEITVANISPAPAFPITATITYHPNGGSPTSIPMLLTPMEVLTVDDALWSWFSVEQGGGIVRITWADDAARITARARVYNTTSSGQYGQGVPGVRLNELGSDMFLTGLSGVNGNRTNVGISNPTSQGGIFWVALYDTSGLERGAFATAIGPHSYRQIDDIFSAFQAGPLHASMIRIMSSEIAFYAYASVVRNDTGDATFITPAR
jgi:hypothetical protein